MMRNTIKGLGFVIGVFCFSGWALAEELLVSVNEEAISALVSNDGTVSFSAGSSETDWLSEAGEPEIPWKFMRVLLPPNADLSTVSCGLVDDEWSAVAGVANVLPATPRMQTFDENQKVIEDWPADKTIVDGRDVAIYDADTFWSGSVDCCSGTGNLQGWKLAEVAVPLARYNPVQGQLEMLTSARLAIRYETQEVLASPNQSVAKRVRDLVVNFDEMAKNYLPAKSTAVSKYPADKKGYLIAATKDVQAASTKLAAFIAHKQSLGFTVTVIDEDDTGGATAGPGAPSVIKFRKWLQANYGPSELRYLLIIADPRTDQANSYFPMGLYNDESPTDYFYAELDCDWDTDLDGIWGEDAEWDRYFELYVGRIPYYGTIADTDSILQKTIDYESSTDVAWRRRGLISTNPLQASDVNRHYYQWAEQVKADLFDPEAIPLDRLYKSGNRYTVSEWATDNQIDPPPEYPTETMLHQQWASTPYGVVALNSHGSSVDVWGIINMNNGDVDALTDTHPSTVFLGACSAATPEAVNNITYAILRNGAITTVGATRGAGLWFSKFADSAGYPGMSYRYQKGVLAHQSCGESFWNLKEETTKFWHDNWTRYNLYGDPSVKVFPEDDRPDFTVLPTHRFYGVRYASSPYSLTSRTYTFVNDSAVSIDWTASKSASWFNLSATSGTIPANSTTTIEVTMNAAVEAFGMGQQLARFTITDTTHSIQYDRGVEFEYKHAKIFRHNQYVFHGADGAATAFGYGDIYDNNMTTQWNATNTVDHLPEYQLDLRMPFELTGFSYMGIYNTSRGRILDYEFYTSMDGTNWGVRVATGSFLNSADAQEVLFDAVSARYVRLVALSIEGGGDVAKLNELELYRRWSDRGIQSRLYADVGGSAISDLTSSCEYPNYEVMNSIRPMFEGDRNRDEIYGGYGVRYDGFIVPPTTGDYTFWVASDDAGQLWLSSDTTTNNLSMIASLSGFTGIYEWTKYSSQQSVTIALTAGVPYAVMGLYKEGGGGDHYAVAWSGPGFDRQVIATPFLSYKKPILSASRPVVSEQSFIIFEAAALGAPVGTMVATDADAGDLLRYYITGENEENRFAIHPTSGVISVVAALDAETTTDYSLDVVVVDESGNNDLAIVDVSVLQGDVIIPPDDLIVHYQFDETTGTTVSDAAGGNNNGTLLGGTWMSTGGVHNGALYLDGIDDKINIVDSPEINTSTVTNRTIALWFRADALVGQGKQMLYEEGGSVHGINLYLDEDALYLNVWDGGSYVSTNGLVADQWYHVALTMDAASGELRGYLDGVEFAQGSCSSIDSHTGDIGIGYVNGTTSCHDLSSLNEASYFAGHVDDFVLYNRTLSASEVVDLTYVNTPPVVSDAAFSIAENGESGSVAGTVSASDDPQDTFSFAITAGNDVGLFSIHPISGIITVIGLLDYEATASHSLTITATDSGGLTDTATILITVTDVPNDDSDADGLLDDWEALHFGSTVPENGSSDPDGDGASNRQEQTFGTNPMDVADAPSAEYLNLRGWWKLDDVTGSTAIDSSGYESHGTMNGPSWETGFFDGALLFDGVDDVVTFGTAPSLNGQTDFTVSAWVKTTSTATGVILQQRGNRLFNGEYQLVLNPDGTVHFMLYGNGEYQYQFSTTQTVNDGAWHFIVAVRDGLDGYIYIDGNSTPAASATGTMICDLDANIPVVLGQDQLTGKSFFNGLIDDVRIYDIALDTVAITNLYVENNTAPVALDDTFAVTESNAVGSVVGTVSASDPDEGDVLAFSITAGDDNGAFAIDSVTGEIAVAGSIDYETLTSYSLTVSVTARGLSDTATILINVTDVVNDDSDTDGLTDEWELTHFSTVAAQTGEGDADSDGLTNAQEETLGSNPNDPLSGPSIGLKAWWKLDKTSGTTAVDHSGNGWDAENVNGTLVGQLGRVGGAFEYDGVDDYSKTIATSEPNSAQFSITAWIKPSTASESITILGKSYQFSLQVTTDAKLRFLSYPYNNSYSDPLITMDEWQFVVLTFTPSAVDGCCFYRNGTLMNAVNSPSIDQNGNMLTLGKNQHGQYFSGGLDDVRLYDRVLSASEVDALYKQVVLNQTPIAQDASFAVEENSTNGSSVGTVSASDPDAGDTLDFSITAGNDEGKFAIDSVTGKITVAGSIDYETLASYSLTVSVTDGITSDTATLSITVTDVPNDDSDIDGLTDEWEVVNFTTVAAQIGSGDADSDGVTNLQEENLGSDPTDPAFPGAEYANLCGWWKFDDLSGTTALDSSGNDNNGLLSGGSWVSGIEAGALDFVAANQDSVELPATAFASIDTEVTFAVWVYGDPAVQPQQNAVLRASDASEKRVLNLHLPWDSTVYWDAGNTGPTYDRIDKPATSSEIAGQWNHWVFTKNATTGDMKIYLNAHLWHSGSGKTETMTGIVSAQIGSAGGTGNFFDGSLDDIRLYNRVLTDTEVADLYHQTTPHIYLSDIDWVSATTGWGTIHKDRSLDNHPITLDGTTYPKGLGTHAQSEIVYNLAGNYLLFHSIVGVDDETGSNGSVSFKVYGDDVLLYETAVITAVGTETLRIDVTGVQTLKLVANDGGDGDGNDHADWADAYIVLKSAGVYTQWKYSKFTSVELANSAISGDDADVDADQLSTLIEYALGLDPKMHSGSLAGCAIELDGSNGWKVEFNRHASHNDIDLVLEWTDELNPANWQPVAQSIEGGVVQALNGTTLVSETGTEPTVVELNVPSTVPHGFIRWKVERR